MKNHATIRNILLASLALLVLSGGCASQRHDRPEAVGGVIDLTNWDFESKGTAELRGEWELYWNRLLSPDDFRVETKAPGTDIIAMPSFWNGKQAAGRTLPGNGYATLRLTVRMPAGQDHCALKIPHMYTAYRLWANGKMVSANGKVGTDVQSEVPQFLPRVVEILSERPVLTLVAQISNFHHPKGGMWSSITIGSETQIRNRQRLLAAFDFFLLGGLIIMGVYHLGIFYFRRKDSASLYFGLLCLVIAIRVPFEGERILIEIFPSICWEINEKISFLTFYGAFIVFNQYIRYLFSDIYSRRMARAGIAISLVFCAVVLAFESHIYFYSRYPFYIVLLVWITYDVWVMIRATMLGKEGSVFLASGFLFLAGAVLIDILYNERIISFGNVVSAGLFIFTFSQAMALSFMSSTAFSRIESLSSEKARLFAASINIISSILLASSTRIYEFTQSVARISVMLARRIGLPDDAVEEIRIAALLHDIGMIGGPDAIISGQHPIAEPDRLIVENHPRKSIQIIESLKELAGVKTIIGQHHERYNGSGYPDRLKGEGIVIGARIIGLVDDFVSMLGRQEFQNGEKKSKIIAELTRNRGALYDPRLVDRLLEISEKNNLIYVVNENDISCERKGAAIKWKFPSNVNFEAIVVRKVMTEIISLAATDQGTADLVGSSLGEVIRNAIIHGNKNDETKPVTVQLSLREKKNRRLLEISVEDRGTGMDFHEYRSFNESRLKLYDITREMKLYGESLDSREVREFISSLLKKTQAFLMDYYINFNKFRRLDSPDASGGVGLIQVMQTFDNVEYMNVIEDNEIRGLKVVLEKYI